MRHYETLIWCNMILWNNYKFLHFHLMHNYQAWYMYWCRETDNRCYPLTDSVLTKYKNRGKLL